VTSGYGAGCHLFQISQAGKEVRASEKYPREIQKTVKNQHGGVILVDGYIYGHSESLGWICQNLKTGELAWKERFKHVCRSGAILAADNRLYLLSEEGTLVLLEANPKEWKETGEFTIPERSAKRQAKAAVWTYPVIAS